MERWSSSAQQRSYPCLLLCFFSFLTTGNAPMSTSLYFLPKKSKSLEIQMSDMSLPFFAGKLTVTVNISCKPVIRKPCLFSHKFDGVLMQWGLGWTKTNYCNTDLKSMTSLLILRSATSNRSQTNILNILHTEPLDCGKSAYLGRQRGKPTLLSQTQRGNFKRHIFKHAITNDIKTPLRHGLRTSLSSALEKPVNTLSTEAP